MEVELIKAIQRQTAVLAQALALLANECGGKYEIIDVERRFDWSDQPGRMIRIYLPEGPAINVMMLDSQILNDQPIFTHDEPDSADKEIIAHWIRRRINSKEA